MTVVRFKNLNVGRSRPSNKFQTHSIGNENLGLDTNHILSLGRQICGSREELRSRFGSRR
jgi:hypothetical protein